MATPGPQGKAEVLVEVGSGIAIHRPSYLHFDVRPVPSVDVVSDARYLPLASKVVDQVYAAHIIEHLSYDGGRKFIEEASRVLRDNGRLELSCPDIARVTQIYSQTRNLNHRIATVDVLKSVLYGGQTHKFDFHRSGYDFTLLTETLKEAGFLDIRRLPPGSGIPVTDRPEVRRLYELHLEAWKTSLQKPELAELAEQGPSNKDSAYLLNELATRESLINSLRQDQLELRHQHERLRIEFTRCQEKLANTKLELEEIKRSFGYNVMKFYANRIDRMLPTGTRRGQFRKLITQSVSEIRENGLITFCEHVAQKTRRKEFHIAQADVEGSRTKPDLPDVTDLPTRGILPDIMFFPIIDWSFRFQRPQQLAIRLGAKGHRVFYLPAHLSGKQSTVSIKRIAENVFQLVPKSFRDFNIYSGKLDDKTLSALLDSINATAQEHDIHGISFVNFPTWAPAAFKLRQDLGWKVVYDCMDEYSAFSNVSHQREEEELLLLRDSDLVITSSLYLNQKARAVRADGIVSVPNGCDFAHFSNLPPNDLLEKLPKPIIGYYGAISEWFDAELVEFIAKRRPNWSIVLIGHTFGGTISHLRRLANIHLLGEQPYDKIPKYLYHFDVCIIPFRISPVIQATNPVKFYEFMAAGKPVVTTDIPELQRFSDICYIGHGKDDFLAKTEVALDEGLLNRERRVKFAANHTWDAAVEVLSSALKEL